MRKLLERVTKLELNVNALAAPNKTQLDQFLDMISKVRRDGPINLQIGQKTVMLL